MIEALLHGKVHNVPSDEKIGAEAHSFDDFQFFFDTAVSLFVQLPVTIGHPVESQLAQQFTVVIYIAGEASLVFRTVIQINLAFI